MYSVAVNATCSGADAPLPLQLLLVLAHTRAHEHCMRLEQLWYRPYSKYVHLILEHIKRQSFFSSFQINSYCFFAILFTHSLTHLANIMWLLSVFVHSVCTWTSIYVSMQARFHLFSFSLTTMHKKCMRADLPYRGRTIFNNSSDGSVFITFLNAFYHFWFVRLMYLSAVAIGTFHIEVTSLTVTESSVYSFWNKSNIKTYNIKKRKAHSQ